MTKTGMTQPFCFGVKTPLWAALIGAVAALGPMGSAAKAEGASAAPRNDAQAEPVRISPENRRLLALALIQKAQGNFDEAIKLLRQGYRNNPDSLMIRRELALALLLNKNFASAKYHFDALENADPDAELRAAYKNFNNIIRRNRKLGFGVQFAILPSTNLNQGTSNSHFDSTAGQVLIDKNAKPISGVGVKLGVSGYFQHMFDAQSRVVADWRISRELYKHKQFNSTSGLLSLTYQRAADQFDWSISTYAQNVWREQGTDKLVYGARGDLSLRLGDKKRLSFSLDLGRDQYKGNPQASGNFAIFNTALSYQLSPSMSITSGFGLEGSRPSAKYAQYNAAKAFVDVSKYWKGGLSTSLGLEIGARKYADTYPNTTSARSDKFYKLNLSLQNDNISLGGFTPRVDCSYKKNISNVAYFDYGTTNCGISFSRSF